MPAQLRTDERIYETSNTVGAGAYGLLGAPTGFQPFSAITGIAANDLVPYYATDDINWEVGIGTYTTGPATLARTIILRSSNGNAAVVWGGGTTQKIRCGWPHTLAVPSVVSKSVAGGADVTLTEAEARCDVLILTGLLTASINVKVTPTPWRWPSVFNNTTGAFGVTFKTIAGAGIAVTQTKTRALFCDGTDIKDAYTDVASVGVMPCDFRLTLTSGSPVTTGDVTAAGTIYCSPYKGNKIALYDGAGTWNVRSSAEFSLALGGLTSGKPYDVFCYDNAGVPTLEFLAWTNDTTRATALTLQDGVLVKTGATTRRYLGTFYTTGIATTEDSAAKRYLWNYYNRVMRSCAGVFSATRSTTSATWVEMNSEIRNSFVIGVAEDFVVGQSIGTVTTSGSGSRASFGISLDGGTPESGGGSDYLVAAANNGHDIPYSCALNKSIAAGFHYTTLFGSIGGGVSLSFVSGTPTAQATQPTRLTTNILG